MTTNITKKTESVKGASDAMNSENLPTVGVVGAGDEQNVEHVKGEKSNHKQKSSAVGVAGKETAEMVIEPKSEYDEEGNEETVEDLTLDDEEMGMDDLDQNAGTSQAGEGSSQGYAPWQHDRSQDELLLAPQEAQQRDPQDNHWTICIKSVTSLNNVAHVERLKKRHSAPFDPTNKDTFSDEKNDLQTLSTSLTYSHTCPRCEKMYAYKKNLKRHLSFECGKKPRVSCPHCTYITRYRHSLNTHVKTQHPEIRVQKKTKNM
uniref:Longitudinals lacking protein, isoforms N/O/W/X/Y n=1 Tax=Zeugodacus cucurbitae TaxID=28588 RepID=A0A0A1XHZ1_ZEUCU